MTYPGDEDQRDGDKRKVANLDASAEKSECEWDVRSRQTSGTKSSGKTETVQKPEGESYQPGLALRQSIGIFLLPQDFIRNKKNA